VPYRKRGCCIRVNQRLPADGGGDSPARAESGIRQYKTATRTCSRMMSRLDPNISGTRPYMRSAHRLPAPRSPAPTTRPATDRGLRPEKARPDMCSPLSTAGSADRSGRRRQRIADEHRPVLQSEPEARDRDQAQEQDEERRRSASLFGMVGESAFICQTIGSRSRLRQRFIGCGHSTVWIPHPP
jgi:hypothetical protein